MQCVCGTEKTEYFDSGLMVCSSCGLDASVKMAEEKLMEVVE